jgi:hypothetical protein
MHQQFYTPTFLALRPFSKCSKPARGTSQTAFQSKWTRVEKSLLLFKGAKVTEVFGLKNPGQFSNQAKSEQNPKKGITFFWQTDNKKLVNTKQAYQCQNKSHMAHAAIN